MAQTHSLMTITEHAVRTGEHTSFYLAAGPSEGSPIIFLHGWPELSLSWRHQLPVFGGLGFRAIAPDLRGYGRSTVYAHHGDYALESVVSDMIDLHDALALERAVWVGHDWGSPVAWSIANHYPERCQGVASLCVPYATIERGLEYLVESVDRNVYPLDKYPAGQWDYMYFYEENFAAAQAFLEANIFNTVKLLFRSGNPADADQPALTSSVRADGGWFGGLPEAPDLAMDASVVTRADLHAYTEALTRNSFFGPDSYYLNHAANIAFTAKAVNDGVVELPALFMAARYDYVCETINSRLAEPMRGLCRNLTEVEIASGHWMAQEKPVEVNAALCNWLAKKLPALWQR